MFGSAEKPRQAALGNRRQIRRQLSTHSAVSHSASLGCDACVLDGSVVASDSRARGALLLFGGGKRVAPTSLAIAVLCHVVCSVPKTFCMLFARVRCPMTDLCAPQLSKINWKHWEGVLPKAYVAKLKASYDNMEAPDSSAEIKQRLAALEHNKKLVPAPSTDHH
jgi:hypothetical protein